MDEIPIPDWLARDFHLKTVTGEFFSVIDGIPSSGGFMSHMLMYDSVGNKVCLQKFNQEGTLVYRWQYDKNGRLLLETAYELSGKIAYRFEYIYNGMDNWKEKCMYLSSPIPHYRVVAKRNASGLILEAVYYDSSIRQIHRDTYHYDDQQRLIRIRMGDAEEWVYSYDADNHLKTKNGNLASSCAGIESSKYYYDDRGLLNRILQIDHSVIVLSYAFF